MVVYIFINILYILKEFKCTILQNTNLIFVANKWLLKVSEGTIYRVWHTNNFCDFSHMSYYNYLINILSYM